MDPKLSAIIVHDIKNALAVLEGELRLLAEEPASPSPSPSQSDRERAGNAHAICLNLQDKLVGFLTLYKASTSGLVAHSEPVSPEDFLTSLTHQLGIGKPGVTLEVATAGMPAVAFFDEHLVTLALEAALQNATRFARSRIALGCVQHADYLSLTVRDDGPGVGAKEKTASTGLGMDLCKAIAAAHVRGERTGVAVLSNCPDGSGALFELRLP